MQLQCNLTVTRMEVSEKSIVVSKLIQFPQITHLYNDLLCAVRF